MKKVLSITSLFVLSLSINAQGIVLNEESIIPGADIISRGISAGEAAMEVVSQNIANQYTTKDVDGGGYKARKVGLETVTLDRGDGEPVRAVQVSEIKKDTSEGMKEYNPHHPHADADGYVEHSNVQISQEMVEMMKYNRWVEAQYAVASASVKMAQNAIALNQQ